MKKIDLKLFPGTAEDLGRCTEIVFHTQECPALLRYRDAHLVEGCGVELREDSANCPQFPYHVLDETGRRQGYLCPCSACTKAAMGVT